MDEQLTPAQLAAAPWVIVTPEQMRQLEADPHWVKQSAGVPAGAACGHIKGYAYYAAVEAFEFRRPKPVMNRQMRRKMGDR